MSGALLVAGCLLIGWALRRRGRLDDAGANALARLVVDAALPCLTFRGVRALRAGDASAVWVPVAAAWIAFVAALALLWIASRALKWDRSTTGAVLVTATVGNTAFVGLPLIEGLFGRDALATATLVDQAGSFVIVSTATVMIAERFSVQAASASVASRIKKLLLFPPVVGSLLGLVTRGVTIPPSLDAITERLASLVVPLALVSVGVRLSFDRGALRRDGAPLAVALLVKLVLSPAIALAAALALGLRGQALAITIAQCAMAPMVTAGLVATDHDLRPELASSLVAVGVFGSLVTVPAWRAALALAGL